MVPTRGRDPDVKVTLAAPAGYSVHRHTQWGTLEYTVTGQSRVTGSSATVGYLAKHRVPRRSGRGSCLRWFYQQPGQSWEGPFQTARAALDQLVEVLEGRRTAP